MPAPRTLVLVAALALLAVAVLPAAVHAQAAPRSLLSLSQCAGFYATVNYTNPANPNALITCQSGSLGNRCVLELSNFLTGTPTVSVALTTAQCDNPGLPAVSVDGTKFYQPCNDSPNTLYSLGTGAPQVLTTSSQTTQGSSVLQSPNGVDLYLGADTAGLYDVLSPGVVSQVLTSSQCYGPNALVWDAVANVFVAVCATNSASMPNAIVTFTKTGGFGQVLATWSQCSSGNSIAVTPAGYVVACVNNASPAPTVLLVTRSGVQSTLLTPAQCNTPYNLNAKGNQVLASCGNGVFQVDASAPSRVSQVFSGTGSTGCGLGMFAWVNSVPGDLQALGTCNDQLSGQPTSSAILTVASTAVTVAAPTLSGSCGQSLVASTVISPAFAGVWEVFSLSGTDVSGNPVSATCQAQTDSTGTASCTLPNVNMPGSAGYQLVASSLPQAGYSFNALPATSPTTQTNGGYSVTVASLSLVGSSTSAPTDSLAFATVSFTTPQALLNDVALASFTTSDGGACQATTTNSGSVSTASCFYQQPNSGQAATLTVSLSYTSPDGCSMVSGTATQSVTAVDLNSVEAAQAADVLALAALSAGLAQVNNSVLALSAKESSDVAALSAKETGDIASVSAKESSDIATLSAKESSDVAAVNASVTQLSAALTSLQATVASLQTQLATAPSYVWYGLSAVVSPTAGQTLVLSKAFAPSNSVISYNNVTGVVTLNSVGLYRLDAFVDIWSPSSSLPGYGVISWVNSATGALIGPTEAGAASIGNANVISSMLSVTTAPFRVQLQVVSIHAAVAGTAEITTASTMTVTKIKY